MSPRVLAMSRATENPEQSIRRSTAEQLLGDRVRQVAVVAALVAVLIMNAAATLLPINGVSTGAVSDANPTFITPAGWTFSVWSAIYLGLTAYAVYQALPRQAPNPRLRAIGWWFVGSSALNITWLLLWHYLRLPLTILAMIALLGSLIVIYQRLWSAPGPAGTTERLVVDLPFSIYLAWITIATIANAAIVLSAAGWGGWGIDPRTWASIMIAVGAGLAAWMAFSRRDVGWALVVVWALAGIAAGQPDAPQVGRTAYGAMAVIAMAVAVGFVRGPGARRAQA